MIKATNLTKTFRELKAVDNVSFEIKKGEIAGFLGLNGAGKTTTMRILTGFLPPTSGTVEIDGVNVLEDPIGAKKKIGYLPEHPPLYPEMTVRGYLNFAAELKGLSGPKKKAEINRAIDMVSLQTVADRLIGNISKGYKQRTGLAQSLLGNPKVLILDEPTVGLDPAQIHEVREIIKNLAEEHTVILSTHILPEVEMTCKRVLIIDKGKILTDDYIENLLKGSTGGTLEEYFLRVISENYERAATKEAKQSSSPVEQAPEEMKEKNNIVNP